MRLRGTRAGDLVVAWTLTWEPGRAWGGAHAVFSHESPTEDRAGLGYAVCACERGSTRLGRGWAVIYGSNDVELIESYLSVPEPNVLVLMFPGAPYEEGAAARIRCEAIKEGRHLVFSSFETPGALRLPRSGAPPSPV